MRFDGSPASHDHVGHLNTSSSPAATNSSGVRTPRVRKAVDFNVGVMYSRADLRLDSKDGIVYCLFVCFSVCSFVDCTVVKIT